MECYISTNKKNCSCTYNCEKKGKCCECIQYHLRMNELPGCVFPPEVEKTYDRSFRNFVECYKDRM